MKRIPKKIFVFSFSMFSQTFQISCAYHISITDRVVSDFSWPVSRKMTKKRDGYEICADYVSNLSMRHYGEAENEQPFESHQIN